MFRSRICLRARQFSLTPIRKPSNRKHIAHLLSSRQILHSRFRWSYVWYTGVLLAGVGAGTLASQFAAPPPVPVRGTRDEDIVLDALNSDIDKLEIVQSMRAKGYNLHSDTALSDTSKGHKGWMELEGRPHADVLGGAGGLGVQRVFWNAETREMVCVIWIGGGLAGWPGVAHGGAISSVFEDAMTRMVAGPDTPIDVAPRPTSMSVTYAKPTHTLGFYVMRLHFTKPKLPQIAPLPVPASEPTNSWLAWLPSWKDLTKKSGPTGSTEILGTLETVKGDLCVKVKGTFPA